MRTIIFSIYLLAGLTAFSQTTTISLKEAQENAQKNRPQFQSDKINQEIAKANIKTQVLKHYPQVNLTADAKANLILPTTVIPAGVFGADKKTVQFGQTFNQTLAADVNQSIYDKKLRYDKEQAELNYQLAEITTTNDEKELMIVVTKSYLNVLINQEREKQLLASKERLLKDKEEIVKKITAGALVELERKRIETTIATTEIQIEQQKEALALSYQLLNYNMGLPIDSKIAVTDTWESLTHYLNASSDKYAAFSPETMPAYRLQKLQIELAQNQYNKQKALLYPTLSAYGYLGVQGLSNNLKYFGDNHIPWFGVSYVGLRLNWNLNPFWENKILLPQQSNRIKQAQSVLVEREEGLKLVVMQAQNAVTKAEKDVLIQSENIKFAKDNLDYLKIRFSAEAVTAREVIDAENDLITLQANELIAKYNALIAKFELRKAMGE